MELVILTIKINRLDNHAITIETKRTNTIEINISIKAISVGDTFR